MCGIGAILRITPSGEAHEPIPEAWLDALDAGIAWRGPDGAGRFRDRMLREDGAVVEVAMVHRRLAIIDLEGGAQPMVMEGCPTCAGSRRATEPSSHERGSGGRVAVVFNGCIYNARALRAELEAKGRRFGTDHSDTEVILHGWREWREELRQRLEGMYAIALWDGEQGELFVLRDRFGEKPLYVAADAGRKSWVVASAVGAIPPKFDPTRGALHPERIVQWLALGAAQQPPAGGAESVGLGELRGLSLGSSAPAARVVSGSTEERASEARIEELLEESVAARLEADVPLGCFLSGGVDSSLVAAMASRRLPKLTTLTVRMPDARYDESRYAEHVAAHLGTAHVTLECDARSAADDLVALIRAMGLPFGDSSILPTYWLCREARKHVKMALAGDGGDELFFGYDRFRAIPLLRRWGWLLRLVPLSVWKTADPRSVASRLFRLCEAAHGEGYPELEAIFGFETRRRVLPRPEHHTLGRAWSSRASPETARRDAMASYLPNDLLRKVDTASMLAGVEVRCPFLDSSLVEAALAAPASEHVRRDEGKYILRQIARKYLPRDVIDRPKQGFAIPISDWWRRDFGGLGTLMMERLGRDRPFGRVRDVIEIDVSSVRQMIDEHRAAGGLAPVFTTRAVRARDHGQRLFALVSVAIWAETL